MAKPKLKYLAGRRLKKADGSFYQIGDDVPEAADWPNLATWIRTGHIVVLGAQGRVDTIRAKPIPKPPIRVRNSGRERVAAPPQSVHVGSNACGAAMSKGAHCKRPKKHGGRHSAKSAEQRAEENAKRKARRASA